MLLEPLSADGAGPQWGWDGRVRLALTSSAAALLPENWAVAMHSRKRNRK